MDPLLAAAPGGVMQIFFLACTHRRLAPRGDVDREFQMQIKDSLLLPAKDFLYRDVEKSFDFYFIYYFIYFLVFHPRGSTGSVAARASLDLSAKSCTFNMHLCSH